MNSQTSGKEDTLKSYQFESSGNGYVISTFQGRVSFQAQQWRALQLVERIDKKLFGQGIDKTEYKIAIVGGGISGVTAFLALRQLGYKKTVLYEAQPEILQTQKSAAHRHAHPTWNDWPLLHSVDGADDNRRLMQPTTNLPFLNWYADNVRNVMTMMREEPLLKRTDIAKGIQILAKVEDIRLNEAESKFFFNAIDHDFTDRNPEPKPESCSTLILATGFGIEKNLKSSDSGSYWWADHAKHFRTEHHNFSERKRYVSGVGDGALIDLFRLLSKQEHIENHEEKNIGLEFLGLLISDKFKFIEEFEKARQASGNKLRVFADDSIEMRVQKIFNDKAKEPGTDPKSKQERGKEFWNDCLNLAQSLLDAEAERIEKPITNFKKTKFNPRSLETTKLVVRQYKEGTPRKFIISDDLSQRIATSTPANAILLALLSNGKTDRLIQYGSVKNKKDLYLGIEGSENIAEPDDIHIARNGVIDPLEDEHGTLLNSDLSAQYKQFKKDMIKNVVEHLPDRIFPSLDFLRTVHAQNDDTPELKSDPDISVSFPENERHRWAAEFLNSIDTSSEIVVKLSEADSPYFFEVRYVSKIDLEKNFRKIGGIPAQLFGRDVSYSQLDLQPEFKTRPV